MLTGEPGDIIFANIEVKNEMNWSWKPGAMLKSTNSFVGTPIEQVEIPIDFEVKENSSFKLCIPIKIKDNEDAFAADKPFEVNFAFVNKNGEPFGETITVKIKIYSIQELQ